MFLWPTSYSSLYLGTTTKDRLSEARNNLESLYPGPPNTITNSRWPPPRRVRRGYPGQPYAAPPTAGPRIAAPPGPPVAQWSAARTKSTHGHADKLLVNRLPCSPIRFKWNFVCLCLRGVIQDGCLRCSGGHGSQLFPGHTDLPPSHPTVPRLASLRPATLRRPAPLVVSPSSRTCLA